MRGNSQVRFLGGLAGAIPPGYPASPARRCSNFYRLHAAARIFQKLEVAESLAEACITRHCRDSGFASPPWKLNIASWKGMRFRRL
jgi:hypothetical protein